MSQFDAMRELRRQLAKAAPTGPDDIVDTFDPWEILPCFYGSYSSAFDDVAILVLENIRDEKFGEAAGEGVAHEMFREVLCTYNLCDYGTSPRGCFPNWGSGFEHTLDDLIDKWRQYRTAQWED